MSGIKKEDIKETKDVKKTMVMVEEPPKKPADKRRVMRLMILLIVVMSLGAFVFWYLNEYMNKNKVAIKKSCGKLMTADGKTEGLAPYKPVLVGSVPGGNQNGIQYCVWTYNGNDFGKTVLYHGKCTRDGLSFSNIGTYKISYKAPFQGDCNSEITLKVTGLSEAEKQRILEVKKSGMTAEDIKLMEEYEKTKTKN